MTPVKLPVIIDSLATRVDGSIKITMSTRELPPQDSARLFELRGTEGWAIFSPNEIKDEDVTLPTDTADAGVGSKTPSKRLRDRMFVFFKEVVHGEAADFDLWYSRELDRLGQKYLEKVENK